MKPQVSQDSASFLYPEPIQPIPNTSIVFIKHLFQNFHPIDTKYSK